MDRRETAALLNYAATLDSRLARTIADQRLAARTIGRWAEALADIPATTPDRMWDAARAVRRYYEHHGGDRSAQFRPVEPHDLLAAWVPHRAELLNRHTDPVPAADPDDVTAYRAELVAVRTAVATGQQPPSTYQTALNPGGQQRLAALTTGTGTGPRTSMPANIAEQLSPYRLTRTSSALDHPCPWCRAQPGQPCRGGLRATTRRRARRPHPSRIEAALTAPTTPPEETHG